MDYLLNGLNIPNTFTNICKILYILTLNFSMVSISEFKSIYYRLQWKFKEAQAATKVYLPEIGMKSKKLHKILKLGHN